MKAGNSLAKKNFFVLLIGVFVFLGISYLFLFPHHGLIIPRTSPLVCLLKDGKVLIIGGLVDYTFKWRIEESIKDHNLSSFYDTPGPGWGVLPTRTWELYDPKIGCSIATGPIKESDVEDNHECSTVCMANGNVLLCFDDRSLIFQLANLKLKPTSPGINHNFPGLLIKLNTGKILFIDTGVRKEIHCELYNPENDTWKPTESLNIHDRYECPAVLLEDGRVLIMGGFTDYNIKETRSCEIYDPVTGRWTLTGQMAEARADSAATLLKDGRVLISGGSRAFNELTTCEIYNPLTGIWCRTSSMNFTRDHHHQVLLANGKVLVFGGRGDLKSDTTCETFDPMSEKWTEGPSMVIPRYGSSCTLLPNGKVLMIGGSDVSNKTLNNAEEFDPATNAWSAL